MILGAQRRRASAIVITGTGLYLDTNSLVGSRMWLPSWKASSTYVSYGCTLTLFADPTDGDMCLANAASDSLTYGSVPYQFTCPPGCTSVRLEVAIKLPAGASPLNVLCGVITSGAYVGGLYIDETPTGTLTPYTLTYTGLTPGVVYSVIWNFNYPSGHAPCLIKYVRVVPLNGTGIFAGTFYRLECDPDTSLFDATPALYFTSGGPENLHRASTSTRYAVTTTATSFVAEVYSFNGSDYPDYNGVGVNVDSVPHAFLDGGDGLQSFTVAAGTHRVELVVAQVWKGSVAFDETKGAWPRALYVGPCTALDNAGEDVPAAPKYLVIGDSISVGFFGDPALGAWGLLTDAGRVGAVMLSAAGRSLYDLCPTPTDATAFVASLAGLDFDAVYIPMGCNDATQVTYGGVAGWQAAMEDVVDKIHAAFPSKPIFLQSIITWATESPLSVSYRTAMAAIAAARVWSTYIDGLPMVPAGELVDANHPGVAGTLTYANAIATAIGVATIP